MSIPNIINSALSSFNCRKWFVTIPLPQSTHRKIANDVQSSSSKERYRCNHPLTNDNFIFYCLKIDPKATCIQNRVGPIIDPCGTPQEADVGLDRCIWPVQLPVQKIVLVHSTFLLAATGASKFGQTKATADSRQFDWFDGATSRPYWCISSHGLEAKQ